MLQATSSETVFIITLPVMSIISIVFSFSILEKTKVPLLGLGETVIVFLFSISAMSAEEV